MWGMDNEAVLERSEARVYGWGMVPMVKRVLVFSRDCGVERGRGREEEHGVQDGLLGGQDVGIGEDGQVVRAFARVIAG